MRHVPWDRPGDLTALAGALRNARSPQEIAFAGTLESRATEALTDARNGNTAAAESLLIAVEQARPDRPETHLIKADPRYLPAFEATAEAYMQKHDLHSAALWHLSAFRHRLLTRRSLSARLLVCRDRGRAVRSFRK